MARKLPKEGAPVERQAAPAADAAPGTPAEEVAALQPDKPLELGGRTFTVREYGVLEGLEVAAQAEAFIADLVARVSDGQFSYQRVRPVIGKHMDAVVPLVARSTGLEPEWIRGLQDRTALDALLMTWFGVNSGFFVHEVVSALQLARVEAAVKAGSTSSPGSAAPASATSTGSPA